MSGRSAVALVPKAVAPGKARDRADALLIEGKCAIPKQRTIGEDPGAVTGRSNRQGLID